MTRRDISRPATETSLPSHAEKSPFTCPERAVTANFVLR